MARFTFTLSCFTILLQLHGTLCEQDGLVDIKPSKIQRFKRSHEGYHALTLTNSTPQIKKVANRVAEVYIGQNPKALQTSRLKLLKPIPTKVNNVIVTSKPINDPRKYNHFFQDIDEDPPISQGFKETNEKQNTKSKPAENTSATHKTDNQSKGDNKIDKVPKKGQENSNKGILKGSESKSKTAEPLKILKVIESKKVQNVTLAQSEKLDDELNGQKTNQTKLSNLDTIDNLDFGKEQCQKENIIEIEEHRYEEQTLRANPYNDQLQPYVKKYCEASQNCQPDYFNHLYLQGNPYENIGNTYKANYDTRTFYGNDMEQSNGNSFYVNLDTNYYNGGNDKVRFNKGNEDYDWIRKTWADIQTTIRTPINPNSEIYDDLMNEKYPYLKRSYQNVMKKCCGYSTNGVSTNPYANIANCNTYPYQSTS